MNKILTLILFISFTLAAKAQNASFSGNLHCTVNGADWNGKVKGAIYSKSEDYLSVIFEDSAKNFSEIQVMFRPFKSEFEGYIPYSDLYEIDYHNLNSSSSVFLASYFPDNKPGTKEYKMTKAQLLIQQLDIASGSIQFQFEATCITGTLNTSMQLENIQTIEIKNASTDAVKFITF